MKHLRSTQRLDKILSNFGYGTRKDIKQTLKDGLVKVDGCITKDGSMHLDPKLSVIEINDEQLKYREFIYVMMNKPDGVISATFDNKLKTVVDMLPEEFQCFDLFPVGRLDIDTEGLLIMTNDGQLTHDLLSPKKHVPKKYYALIDGEVTQDDVNLFKQGVLLNDGFETLPADLEILRTGIISEIELVIYEGKFHQVKRMFESVGKKVKYLRRTEMGALKLDKSLQPGMCRELTEVELDLLKGRYKLQKLL